MSEKPTIIVTSYVPKERPHNLDGAQLKNEPPGIYRRIPHDTSPHNTEWAIVQGEGTTKRVTFVATNGLVITSTATDGFSRCPRGTYLVFTACE